MPIPSDDRVVTVDQFRLTRAMTSRKLARLPLIGSGIVPPSVGAPAGPCQLTRKIVSDTRRMNADSVRPGLGRARSQTKTLTCEEPGRLLRARGENVPAVQTGTRKESARRSSPTRSFLTW